MAVTDAALSTIVAELERVAPGSRISTDSDVVARYTADSYWKALALRDRGTPLGRPDIVVNPVTDEQVAAILKVASKYKVPVVPWGGGSGSQGGSVPVRGGLVVDLRNLNKITHVDRESCTVTVQAGMNGAEFEAELNAMGLMFPHYPASAEWATVGGYVAARGSGVLSTRYGKIEDLTISMRVALPDGTLFDLLPVTRHAVGPDLSSLFIGSEGTLGIITSVTVQVMPLPSDRLFAAAAFDNTEQGVEAYRRAMVMGYRPAVIRLYDEIATEHTLRPVAEAGGQTPSDPVIAVMTFEGEGSLAQAERDGVMGQVLAGGGREIDQSLASHWWAHRYDFYHPPYYPTLPKVWGTFDIVAPYRTLMPAYRALQESVAEPYARYGLQLRTHFSHWYQWGAMYYARFVMPDPGPDVLEIHEQIWDDGMKAIVAAGGLLNDHHGVGLKLAPWMREQHGHGLDLLRGFKALVDPNNILNPGKLAMDLDDPQ